MAESTVDSPTNMDDNFNWKETTYTLDNIIEDLPKICKYEGDVLTQGLKLYSRQPVLLYKWCRKKKADVRTIYRDRTGPYYEVGQTLQIPDDFEG